MKRGIFTIAIIFAAAIELHAQNWLATGNAGTTSANFIGTTDAQAFRFKTNNQISGIIDFSSSSANTSLGFQSLRLNIGNNNSAFGYRSMWSNTTGRVNTSMGAYSLYNNTIGYSNTAIGIAAIFKNSLLNNLVAVGDSALYNNTTGTGQNTAIGSKSLYANTSGYANTAIGYQSMYSTTIGQNNTASGTLSLNKNVFGSNNTANGFKALLNNGASYNTAIGYYAMLYNSTGQYNTATGSNSLQSNTSGYSNTANGDYALNSNSTGNDNTAMGAGSLGRNTTGGYNTALGKSAAASNTTGAYNMAAGYYALYNNTTGLSNVAIGKYAMYRNTTIGYTVAIGDSALHSNGFGATSALHSINNTAIGSKSQAKNTTGYRNTSVGFESLISNTTGGYNIGIGHRSLSANTTQFYNTAIGANAMEVNTGGSNNTAVGGVSLYINSGDLNTAIGFVSMYSNSGSNNTAVGSYALYSSSSCSAITAIGADAGVTVTGISNSTALGRAATVDASNKIRLGNASVTSIGGQVGWTNFSDIRVKKNIKENVPGLRFINLLKPITYNFDLAKEYALLGKTDSSSYVEKMDIEKINFTGFAAQDVDAAAKKIGYDFSGVDKSGKIMGLRYSEFVVPLVKAVQELSAENEALKSRLDKIEAMLLSTQQNTSSTSNQNVILSSAYSLEQNIPNPFKGATTINCVLPVNSGNAYINFYNLNGTLLKSIKVTGQGKNTISLSANELATGTYKYVLMVDGKIIDSKQMILQK